MFGDFRGLVKQAEGNCESGVNGIQFWIDDSSFAPQAAFPIPNP